MTPYKSRPKPATYPEGKVDVEAVSIQLGHTPFREWDMEVVNSSGRLRKNAMDILADRVFPFVREAHEANMANPLKIDEPRATLFFDALRGSLARKIDAYPWVPTINAGCTQHAYGWCEFCQAKGNRCSPHEGQANPGGCPQCQRVDDAVKQELLKLLSLVPKYDNAKLAVGERSRGMIVSALGLLRAQKGLLEAIIEGGFADGFLAEG